jgi:glucose/mannose-6-phosphate isomerase
MISLDDRDELSRLDPEDMLGLVDSFPGHCREGWALGTEWARRAGSAPKSLIVAGMGGSAMAGDLVRGLFSEALPLPLAVIRDYKLPGWAGPYTTVICCSYSGDTEETLSAFDHSLEVGARVLVISSGGALSEEASKRGIARLPVPPGMPPRAALGYSLFGLFALVHGWGLASGIEEEVEESLAQLEEARGRWGVGVPEEQNEAKGLARALAPALPVLCAPEGPLAAVGFRWRTQLNENSKMAAYNCVFPELDHNEIVGWAKPFNVGQPAAVFLRGPGESERMKLRIEVTRTLLERAGVPVVEAWSEAEGVMAGMAGLTLLGDYVSIYAAFLRGFDPTPVEVIGALKKALSEGKPL